MRQSLIWLLMMVVTVLGACGDEAVEVEELPLDSAVFETGLTESEDLLETDHVIDLALASPFYQSEFRILDGLYHETGRYGRTSTRRWLFVSSLYYPRIRPSWSTLRCDFTSCRSR